MELPIQFENSYHLFLSLQIMQQQEAIGITNYYPKAIQVNVTDNDPPLTKTQKRIIYSMYTPSLETSDPTIWIKTTFN